MTGLLKFGCKVELYLRKILLRHRQHIRRVGQIHIPPFMVNSHILRLTLLETVEHCFIVAFYPACLVKVDRFPAALRSVLVEQAVLNDLIKLRKTSYNIRVRDIVPCHSERSEESLFSFPPRDSSLRFGMTKDGVRTPHKKRANTRFAPTLTTLITADYFSLFVFRFSLFTCIFVL